MPLNYTFDGEFVGNVALANVLAVACNKRAVASASASVTLPSVDGYVSPFWKNLQAVTYAMRSRFVKHLDGAGNPISNMADVIDQTNGGTLAVDAPGKRNVVSWASVAVFPPITGLRRKFRREIRSLSDGGADGQRARFSASSSTIMTPLDQRVHSGKVFERVAGVWVEVSDAEIEGDIVESIGAIQDGDIIGAWIAEDIQAMLNLYRWTWATRVTSGTAPHCDPYSVLTQAQRGMLYLQVGFGCHAAERGTSYTAETGGVTTSSGYVMRSNTNTILNRCRHFVSELWGTATQPPQFPVTSTTWASYVLEPTRYTQGFLGSTSADRWGPFALNGGAWNADITTATTVAPSGYQVATTPGLQFGQSSATALPVDLPAGDVASGAPTGGAGKYSAEYTPAAFRLPHVGLQRKVTFLQQTSFDIGPQPTQSRTYDSFGYGWLENRYHDVGNTTGSTASLMAAKIGNKYDEPPFGSGGGTGVTEVHLGFFLTDIVAIIQWNQPGGFDDYAD